MCMRGLTIILCVLLVSACGSTPQRHEPVSKQAHTSKQSSKAAERTKIVKTALSQVGRPYRYGGTTPHTGFDCSGLVYYSHQSAGLEVPRNTRLQLKKTRKVNRAYLQPGDLLFYLINNKPNHVGIYIGDGKFVHAPSSGKKVSIVNMDSDYWRRRLYATGTFLH